MSCYTPSEISPGICITISWSGSSSSRNLEPMQTFPTHVHGPVQTPSPHGLDSRTSLQPHSSHEVQRLLWGSILLHVSGGVFCPIAPLWTSRTWFSRAWFVLRTWVCCWHGWQISGFPEVAELNHQTVRAKLTNLEVAELGHQVVGAQ